jgi:hypothetical protein
MLLRFVLIAVPLVGAFGADSRLTNEQRMEIIRTFTAEYATAKAYLPRSKKALSIDTKGNYDKTQWESAAREFGPAARVGDLLQITKVSIENDKIVLEINHGMSRGRKWYNRIEEAKGKPKPKPPAGPSEVTAPGGTTLALSFGKPIPSIESADIKRMLSPVLDFEKRTTAEKYLESLPQPIQDAIKEKRAIEGMDRAQVTLALGRPLHKMRETRDGLEIEDWVYGAAPGKITYVTFQGSKVVKIKEAYAGLGGSKERVPIP